MRQATPVQPKLTTNQRAILDIIEGNGVGTHVTAYDLLALAKRRRPGIGLATIHRALNQLHEDGLIAKVLVPGMESATYEPLAHRHAHFRCKRCGEVSDVEYAVSDQMLAQLSTSLGHQIDEEQVAFSGVCSTCLHKPKRRMKRA